MYITTTYHDVHPHNSLLAYSIPPPMMIFWGALTARATARKGPREQTPESDSNRAVVTTADYQWLFLDRISSTLHRMTLESDSPGNDLIDNITLRRHKLERMQEDAELMQNQGRGIGFLTRSKVRLPRFEIGLGRDREQRDR
jgi:hypothetical protein